MDRGCSTSRTSIRSMIPELDDNGYPFGRSLFYDIMATDPTSETVKWLCLIVTSLLLCGVPFLDKVLNFTILLCYLIYDATATTTAFYFVYHYHCVTVPIATYIIL
jgi:hypothetical protein